MSLNWVYYNGGKDYSVQTQHWEEQWITPIDSETRMDLDDVQYRTGQ